MATSNDTSNTNGKIERVCSNCGKTFYISYLQLMQTAKGDFCGYTCAGEARRKDKHYNWKGGHSDYRGPNWSEQRKAAYKRDGGVCQVCNRKQKKGERKFAVHHIKPFREFNGDYIAANDLSNLAVVCENCHMRVERGLVPIQRPLL